MTFLHKNLKPDEYLAIVSALAEAQDLSECDITPEDIEEFCHATGWGQEQAQSKGNGRRTGRGFN